MLFHRPQGRICSPKCRMLPPHTRGLVLLPPLPTLPFLPPPHQIGSELFSCPPAQPPGSAIFILAFVLQTLPAE